MQAIIFYLFFPLIFLISILPFRVLYLLSDLLFPVIYHLVGYRKKIVFSNLKHAFPEKSEEEILKIARKFYRHFTDVIFEIIKMRTISPGALRKRINYSNPELLRKYHDENKGVMGMSAHFNNWEWTSACSEWGPHHPVVIYKPLRNKQFDRFMKITRTRHGVEMIPMRETLRKIISDQKAGRLVLYGLISDQTPVWEETQHWTTFLNQDTAVFTGAAKLALRTGLPAVYFSMRKIRRGRYIIDLETISEDHAGKNENDITDAFFRSMEKKIRENPEYWLWTHRRWKLTDRKKAQMKRTVTR